MAIIKNTDIAGTDGIQLPVGTTAQRPASPEGGDMRFNSTLDVAEYYYDGSLTGVSATDVWRSMPDITRSSLIVNLDAAEPDSYPGSGTNWNDLAGGTDDGTLENGVGYSTANGGILTLDGTNDSVTLGTPDFFSNDGRLGSIEWIVNMDNFTSGGETDRFWGGNGGSFECRFDASNQLVFDIGASSSLTSNKTDWSANTWYVLCFTWNTRFNRSSFYVNGTLDNTGTATFISLTTSESPFRLGKSGGSASYMDGKYAAFRVYGRELTNMEIFQNFYAVRTRFGY